MNSNLSGVINPSLPPLVVLGQCFIRATKKQTRILVKSILQMFSPILWQTQNPKSWACLPYYIKWWVILPLLIHTFQVLCAQTTSDYPYRYWTLCWSRLVYHRSLMVWDKWKVHFPELRKAQLMENNWNYLGNTTSGRSVSAHAALSHSSHWKEDSQWVAQSLLEGNRLFPICHLMEWKHSAFKPSNFLH